jgi:hypothetical protein
MPDVVRLRNNYGHPVELDHVPGPNPDHGDVVEVPGTLVTDEAEYRRLMGIPTDPSAPGYVALPPDVGGYIWVLGADGQLRGWPMSVWDLVTEAPSTVDTKAKGK